MPQVAFGGAPDWLATPPWHMVHVVFQAAPWQEAHETPAEPPDRSWPWQPWQLASPAFALYAWNPELV